MRGGNLFATITGALPDELFDVLAEGGAFKLVRIVSRGHATPAGQWYDQPDNEWVVLLQGSAGVLLAGEDEVHVLGPGDYLFLPAHLKHRVVWTDAEQDTVWLALHYDVPSAKTNL